MIKKLYLLLIVIIIIFSFSGCSDSYSTDDLVNDFLGIEDSYPQRFFIISNRDFDEAYIILDKKTGVQYLFRKYMNAGGMCVLVDRDGKPLLYEESEDIKYETSN